ncbi:hypothetical protein OAO01_01250 [Oligoflexia bacterium]|nr:hypothetical protein [Oligoflexia bacterium]
MFSFLAKLCLSFIVSAWVYSEVVYFLPQIDVFGSRIVEATQIPTHDQWPAIASAGDAAALKRELNQSLRAVTSKHVAGFGSGLEKLWSTTTSKRVARLFGIEKAEASQPAPDRPYFTGDAVFVFPSSFSPLKGEIDVLRF